jgi:hypothetical protein
MAAPARLEGCKLTGGWMGGRKPVAAGHAATTLLDPIEEPFDPVA